jgi:hypothetical protein
MFNNAYLPIVHITCTVQSPTYSPSTCIHVIITYYMSMQCIMGMSTGAAVHTHVYMYLEPVEGFNSIGLGCMQAIYDMTCQTVNSVIYIYASSLACRMYIYHALYMQYMCIDLSTYMYITCTWILHAGGLSK